jgi:large subunit ribosomal protein L31e
VCGFRKLSEPDIEVDREYVVPLTRAWITPRHQRTARAIRVLREYAIRHMKSSEVKIDTDLSEKIWSRGITKPPRRIKVRMTKDEEGLVTISLPKREKVQTAEEPASKNEAEGSDKTTSANKED